VLEPRASGLFKAVHVLLEKQYVMVIRFHGLSIVQAIVIDVCCTSMDHGVWQLSVQSSIAWCSETDVVRVDGRGSRELAFLQLGM
jgi:hypothetical protein